MMQHKPATNITKTALNTS